MATLVIKNLPEDFGIEAICDFLSLRIDDIESQTVSEGTAELELKDIELAENVMQGHQGEYISGKVISIEMISGERAKPKAPLKPTQDLDPNEFHLKLHELSLPAKAALHQDDPFTLLTNVKVVGGTILLTLIAMAISSLLN
jgi:hypothetical protein